MARYPKKDLPRDKGEIFCTAFAFPATGPIMFTGGEDKITAEINQLPPCHYRVTHYCNRIGGKHHFTSHKVNLPHHFLTKVQRLEKKPRYSFLKSERRLSGKPNQTTWQLTGPNSVIIKEFRHVPNKYIKELEM